MEVDARAEMPVKIIAIDADADAVLLDDRLCSLQPVLAGQILAVELKRKRTIKRGAMCDGFERFGPLLVDGYADLGSARMRTGRSGDRWEGGRVGQGGDRTGR